VDPNPFFCLSYPVDALYKRLNIVFCIKALAPVIVNDALSLKPSGYGNGDRRIIRSPASAAIRLKLVAVSKFEKVDALDFENERIYFELCG
jgi:hypothetical protein